ncbi:MAG: hypothetical protein IKG84_04665 [Bacteroidales bacterium]|nr:hypothetical protein [Bacteroidales bacterium]
MTETYEPGELFVYTNGDCWELGMVKGPNNSGDGYFCWYSRVDTAVNTPTSRMHKLANAGITHIEQLLDDAKADDETCKLTIEKIRSHGPWIYHYGYGYDFWQPITLSYASAKALPELRKANSQGGSRMNKYAIIDNLKCCGCKSS